MLVGQMVLSVIVAIAATAVSLIIGNGVLFSLALYMASGTLTLTLLSAWAWVRADI